MPSPPTSSARRYLDVLRTLGVTDGTIRRHHGVAPEESLQARLASELETPTDQLLDLLAASGVVVDLEAVAPVDADRLAMSLARFGFVVECSAVGDEMEIVGFDAVAEDVQHLRVEPEREALRSALVDRILGPAGAEAVQLVDDRTLVADGRALAHLRDRYGSRIEPFDTPLLSADVDGDLTATPAFAAGSESAARPIESGAASAGPAGGLGSAGSAGSSTAPAPSNTADSSAALDPTAEPDSAVTRAVAEAGSVGDALETADDQTAAAIEDALSDSGPAVHTADGTEDDVAAVQESSIGGGPRRTVSTTGIDEVFAQLEDEAESRAERPDDGAAAAAADDPFTTPVASTDEQAATHDDTMDSTQDETQTDTEQDATDAEQSDTAQSDAPQSNTADDGPGGLAGGGPTRTVSETSADDILQRVGGGTDFDDIAEDEAEADPDAVLADAGDVPEVDDAPEDGSSGADASDSDASDRDSSAGDQSDDDAPAGGPGAQESNDTTTADSAADTADDSRTTESQPSPAGADTDPSPSTTVDDSETDPDADVDRSTDGGTAAVTRSDSDVDVDDAAETLPSTAVDDAGSDSPPAEGEDEAVDQTSSESGDSGAEVTEVTDSAGASTIDAVEGADSSSDGSEAAVDASPADDSPEHPQDADDGTPNSPTDPDSTTAPSDADDGRPDLGDDLLGDDVEVRKGTEAVDVDAAALADRDPDPTDGPLAAAGGVAPVADDASSEEERPEGAESEQESGSDSDDESGLFGRVRSALGL